MQTELIDFFSELDQSETEQEAGKCLLSFLQNLGADGGNIWFATSEEKDCAYSKVTSYPAEFIEETRVITQTKSNLIPELVARQTAPVRWGWNIDQYKYEKESGDYIHSKLSLDVLGLRNALIFPIRTIGKAGTSGVSFYTTGSRENFETLIEERGMTLAYASWAAHTLMQTHRDKTEIKLELSPREAECLLWVAKGLRIKEIACRLSIREVTAHFHIQNAKTKLGAKTQTQAVVIAILAGLIHP